MIEIQAPMFVQFCCCYVGLGAVDVLLWLVFANVLSKISLRAAVRTILFSSTMHVGAPLSHDLGEYNIPHCFSWISKLSKAGTCDEN